MINYHLISSFKKNIPNTFTLYFKKKGLQKLYTLFLLFLNRNENAIYFHFIVFFFL